MTIFRFSIAVAALTLSACNFGQNDNICSRPPMRPSFIGTGVGAQSVGEQMSVTESCVHNWAYRLAPAQGTNREIADAVVGGCREAIAFEANLRIEERTGREADGLSEAAEFDRIRKIYFDSALFFVVQARAGKCDIP